MSDSKTHANQAGMASILSHVRADIEGMSKTLSAFSNSFEAFRIEFRNKGSILHPMIVAEILRQDEDAGSPSPEGWEIPDLRTN